MSGLVAHIARRGVEAAVNIHQSMNEQKPEDGEFKLHLPVWGVVLFVLTGFAFMLTMAAVSSRPYSAHWTRFRMICSLLLFCTPARNACVSGADTLADSVHLRRSCRRADHC